MKMWSGGSTIRLFGLSVSCTAPRLLSLVIVLCQIALSEATSKHFDIHGGVQMGVSDHKCDDAKTNLTVDWDPREPYADMEYQCQDHHQWPVRRIPAKDYCQTSADLPLHKCMNESIHYPDTLPLSGAHRPLWPVYGEYIYLPPQRWLHSMEHGAVVLLYHPCADRGELNFLKAVVRSCLRRHIITPYRHLPITTPFALLTWKCKLTLSYVDQPLVEDFIKEHAILPAPEGMVYKDGQYDLALDKPAEIVSDKQDSVLCPRSTSQNSKYPSADSDLPGEMADEILSSIHWNRGRGA